MVTLDLIIDDINKEIEKNKLQEGDMFWISSEKYEGYSLTKLRHILKPLLDNGYIKPISIKLTAPQSEQYVLQKLPLKENS